ncbi:hypothetical protein [Streptomyces gibsoniae]|uniref:Uncharacterized protein n=1 Tax=Streptomyces gibsoniae TaxID=3075529 RepID=A0ABU2TZR9_9ACTN|nr:hypothetical protein [Streptomyces sp. DSM 41699]MDT0466475.1 hypothetical protein [Streptomyces sp. DSM 41699]
MIEYAGSPQAQLLLQGLICVVIALISDARWGMRAVTAPQLVALARAGARFERDHLIERLAVVAA